MKKFKTTTEGWAATTRCPWYQLTGLMVGSFGCVHCFYHDHMDIANNEVYCKHD